MAFAIRRVAAEFSDPLTTPPQLFLQDAYTTENHGTEARVPETSLLPFVQLIRPSFSYVTVPTGEGKSTVSAFGDI